MKCAAGDMIYSQKESAVSREYGMWMLEWIDTVAGIGLAELFGFRAKRLQRFYDGSRDGLCDDVGRYTTDSMRIKNRSGWKSATETERLDDGIDTTMLVMERDLAAMGIGAESLNQLAPSDPLADATFISYKRRAIHGVRSAWYEVNGKRAVRLYTAYTLLYLHNEYGFGEARLKKALDAIVPEVRRYVVAFLESRDERDNEIKAEFLRKQKRLAEFGVAFVELPDENKVDVVKSGSVIKNSAVSTLSGSRKMSQYNEIMEQVKKSWRVK